MAWARRALYLLPLLVAGACLGLIFLLQLAGAWCSDLDSGHYRCNTAGTASWTLFYLGFLLTAISLVTWAVVMLRMFVRRRRTAR
jgi:hypothetical protein